MAGTTTLLVLATLVCIHVYLVTKYKHAAPDADNVALARIDVREAISADDADKIGKWLYARGGVEHVQCNPASHMIVFSFRPAQASADEITVGLASAFKITAKRYMPSAAELKGGCPVAATSVTYKAYNFIKHIF